tara:strand:- start:626 stop:871 length:246 start_codon:yes stop_codon:yes gene_type:complete
MEPKNKKNSTLIRSLPLVSFGASFFLNQNQAQTWGLFEPQRKQMEKGGLLTGRKFGAAVDDIAIGESSWHELTRRYQNTEE